VIELLAHTPAFRKGDLRREKSIVPIEGTRILCVEDDPTTCNLLRLLLRKHTVITAASTDEALGLAVLFPFNLYLLKAQYSDGSGIEFCRQLRALDGSIPVLFLSGDRTTPPSGKQWMLGRGPSYQTVRP
jgi:response regulator RpfG family c-di-GMP phosphodiesterase